MIAHQRSLLTTAYVPVYGLLRLRSYIFLRFNLQTIPI